MKYYFRYFVYDEDPREELDENAQWLVDHQFQLAEPLRDGTEGELTLDKAKEILGVQPFYEVELMCMYNDKTHKMTILNAKS